MAKPLIVFDWDGTLAHSMPLCIREITLALERTGVGPRSEELIRACNGPTHIESLDVLSIPQDLRDEFLQQRLKAEIECIPQVLELFPGIAEMMHQLYGKADMVIASNGILPYVSLGAEVTGMKPLLDRIEASIPGRTKAQAIAEMLRDYQPSRAIMVGDRAGDFEAGKANALPTIACTYGYGTPAEYAMADVQLDTVAQLTDYLIQWSQGSCS